ncbi:MAG: coproporphyrinogen III oxidase [Zetaproteobacteria bacterium CG12_big_fil_rev_8_21_14_0_65_55_1124]|nr:MAG: coproporphyrinogen III oxidase [Zetaproteobacteria bacterium CG1_02_55_237]PIS19204.1 MAG: coproporphyrinogen III oxidase [Zetaproteobacteria bacterium CG08_land_8_20_14_0_20_55_17]PIW42935.1 MAG: coproporphyrinogen III oxidase [Zetaproteobacteria bacterium CG12_big_fil_rev_8_21_14_0_65_55_1124]PIY51841.1 MAG: coproporphyrinogen III oxidase [Zetaproteobacteria bacterium CG_4_10_14_0_8_um_filter_55_43]PIZ39901.1 MAG: coproporphyrinogen III oxidase [Zetaproteobacteria bacterium CG_4_10_14
MKRIPATSASAGRALELVSSLQHRFVQGLEKLAADMHSTQRFADVQWLRDDGRHGGGVRYETADGDLIGRGSVNVSQVHYDDEPAKKLASANAISTIIHPVHPLAPSVHIHISWTEMKDGSGYWRMMADLNPSNELEADKTAFFAALEKAAPQQFAEAKEQGERYFFIPVLGRHRGVAHFYLENYNSGDAAADFALAKSVGEAAIDSYVAILDHALRTAGATTAEQKDKQLAYHTLYFFQVLTLDRGTTTGLLVHDQNDVGIMGSLPARVDRDLLTAWIKKMPAPQDRLLASLIDVLPPVSAALVDEAVKQRLAAVVRAHYREYPEAISMQASGDVIPSTVQNHR